MDARYLFFRRCNRLAFLVFFQLGRLLFLLSLPYLALFNFPSTFYLQFFGLA